MAYERQERPKPPQRQLTAEERTTAAKLAEGKWTEMECNMIWVGMGPFAQIPDFHRFLYFCVQKDLNPLLNEVHAEFKWSKADQAYKIAIVTHIEAYRRLADQTGNYDGQEEAFTEVDGRLISCTIRTYRKDCARPFPYTAFLSEYKPDYESQTWTKMPHVMLRKVAEAASLRCAFPAALSGAYIGEEMSQTGQQQTEGEPEYRAQAQSAGPRVVPPPSSKDNEEMTAGNVIDWWQRMTNIPSIVEVFNEVKDNCTSKLGTEDGEKFYYSFLEKYGVKHSNEFRKFSVARSCLKDMYLSLLKEPVPEVKADEDDVTAESVAPPAVDVEAEPAVTQQEWINMLSIAKEQFGMSPDDVLKLTHKHGFEGRAVSALPRNIHDAIMAEWNKEIEAQKARKSAKRKEA